MSTNPDRLDADLARVRALATVVRDAGGRALIVGGYARDEALRRLGERVESKDVDVEVYGLRFDDLLPLLSSIGRVDIVGAAFAVAKISQSNIDVSIPRRESKVGRGHRGFAVEGDPSMSLRDAMRRRDFTINALALDPLTGDILDEHGGLDDLRGRVLRATDATLFGDDPLRALRAMQLAARFAMRLDPATADMCRALDLGELPAERIGDEWSKLLLRARRPSVGLRVGRDIDVIRRLHPQLEALAGAPRDPDADAWTHTLHAVDAAAEALRGRADMRDQDRLAVMLGTLCHRLDTPATSSFLATLRAPGDLTAIVLALVGFHQWPAHTTVLTDQAVRRLARDLVPATIDLLVLVAAADNAARDPGFNVGPELLARAAELGVRDGAEPPIIKGRHLLELGLTPGPQYSRILDLLYDAQEAGEFSDVAGGIAYLRASGVLSEVERRTT